MYQTIEDALAALPDTAAGIADYFTEKGITGMPGGCSCPIANYLRTTTPFPQAWVCRSKVLPAIDGQIGAYASEDNAIPLPAAARSFIVSFDLGHAYQNLREDLPTYQVR